MDFIAFHAWALRSGYRRGLVLTRVDHERPYDPNNCVWMERAAWIRLHRPTTVSHKPRWTITAFGETKGPTAWSRDPRCMVTAAGLVMRIRAGMSPEQAITKPSTHDFMDVKVSGVAAFGTTKSIFNWARDRRARVSADTIRERIQRGVDAERAITTPPFLLEGAPPPAKRRAKRRRRQGK